jgi:Skp family chaperone for outer membrane proteins
MRYLILLFFSSFAVAQSATTSGPCSPIAAQNTGSITINCPGISGEEGRKMLAILNRIIANQINPDLVMVKLDEIQHGVSSIESELAEKKKQEEESERKRRTAPIIIPSLVPVSGGKVNLCVRSIN